MSQGNAFVTGVHTGIGWGLARACLATGRTVYATSRRAPEGLDNPERFLFQSLDLRCFDEIPETLGRLLAQVSSLDIVILNAGMLGKIKDLKDTSLDEINGIMDLNVYANKVIIDTLMRLNIPIKQVVAISSGSAVNGSAGWGGYSISKSALNLLIRVYAHEHPGTHFTALAPGLVETALLERVLAHPDSSRYEALTRIRAAKADGRVMTKEATADLILNRLNDLLATPTGAYVDIRNL